MTDIFNVPIEGWRKMCRFIGVCEPGLYLAERSKFEASHLCGQPDARPLALFRVITQLVLRNG